VLSNFVSKASVNRLGMPTTKKKKGYESLPTFESDHADEDDFVMQHSRSQQMMKKQDESLDVLSEGVMRLGEMSMGIHDELREQNRMLGGCLIQPAEKVPLSPSLYLTLFPATL